MNAMIRVVYGLAIVVPNGDHFGRIQFVNNEHEFAGKRIELIGGVCHDVVSYKTWFDLD
jgi:hypothetical protein